MSEGGSITGTDGCNRMRGKATISGNNMTFGMIATTPTARSPAVMAQEGKFFAALRDVRKWRADPTRHKLAPLTVQAKHWTSLHLALSRRPGRRPLR